VPNLSSSPLSAHPSSSSPQSLLEPEERARLRLPAGGLRVHLSDGGSLVAAQVVLSCAHTQPAPLPPALAAGGPSSSLLQGPAACDADAVTLQGARVAVVGGGTSAATLALCALHRGATQVRPAHAVNSKISPHARPRR
jgi:cation diffusion facilitator CzcD-associated flavoprotein CzcO